MVRLFNPVTNRFEEVDDYEYFDVTGSFPRTEDVDMRSIRKGDIVIITNPKTEPEMAREGKKARVTRIWKKTKEITIEFNDGEEMDVSINSVKGIL